MSHAFIRSVSIDWDDVAADSYLRAIPALSQLGEPGRSSGLDLDQPLTFFAGENGTGKSTLLEAIAVAYGFNPEGGTLNYRFQTYDDVSDLSQAVRLQRGLTRPAAGYFLRAESFFNVATQAERYRIEGGYGEVPAETYYRRYGGRSFHEQSHGESFFALLSELDDRGLYLLDEPEAALSPQRQLALLHTLASKAELGAQFIIASHSPILLGIPNARIYDFSDGAVRPVTYEETSSYQVTELFINNRISLLRNLLDQ